MAAYIWTHGTLKKNRKISLIDKSNLWKAWKQTINEKEMREKCHWAETKKTANSSHHIHTEWSDTPNGYFYWTNITSQKQKSDWDILKKD